MRFCNKLLCRSMGSILKKYPLMRGEENGFVCGFCYEEKQNGRREIALPGNLSSQKGVMFVAAGCSLGILGAGDKIKIDDKVYGVLSFCSSNPIAAVLCELDCKDGEHNVYM